MPSNPSCCTMSSCLSLAKRDARGNRVSGRARRGRPLVRGLVDQPFWAGGHPRVEPPLSDRYRRFLAMPGQDPCLSVQRKDARADRANLAREVVEIALMRDRAAAADDVTGEQHAELPAVQADCSGTVA